MSRLDCFLLSEEWCFQWPNCFQVALLRGVSDHCPLHLSVDEENWGPRPSRMLKCWEELSGYKQFVQDKWKDGDANSKYFHSVLASGRRWNAIVSLLVNGNIVEGIQPIRNAIFTHFKEHFVAPNVTRPRVENLLFKNLSYAEGSGLIKPFSEGEVKAAVWDCDSFKSPSLDGVNLGFIKDI